MTEIEFVCCNPNFEDATAPDKQMKLMNSLRSIPGTTTYRQDWGSGETSLATIVHDDAPKHTAQTISTLAKRHGVNIDLETDDQDILNRRLDDLATGSLEGLTHHFRGGHHSGPIR